MTVFNLVPKTRDCVSLQSDCIQIVSKIKLSTGLAHRVTVNTCGPKMRHLVSPQTDCIQPCSKMRHLVSLQTNCIQPCLKMRHWVSLQTECVQPCSKICCTGLTYRQNVVNPVPKMRHHTRLVSLWCSG